MSADAPQPTADAPAGAASPARARLGLLLPLAVFLGLAALFFFRLGAGDASRVPSVLIGRPAPDFALPPLEGRPGGQPGVGLSDEALAEGVHLVNVWASWCGPCRVEHPVLMRLKEEGRVTIHGINYKDVPENARRFLGTLGDPYAQVGADSSGRAAIEWGVYGVPETFLVKDGIIVHKVIGPVTEDALAGDLAPAIEKALR